MDGEGIGPDRPVSLGTDGELEAALDRRAAFFFYANHFAAENAELPQPFTISDEIYQDFRGWLEEQDFAYSTDAERAVEALEDDLTKNGYGSTGDELDALRHAVAKEKDADFDRYAPELKERLRSEILARYRGESAQIAASFRHDRQILDAVALLKDTSDYRAILAPR